MEIAIIKRETTGSGPVNVFTENETIAKYEIMDGAPVKGKLFHSHQSAPSIGSRSNENALLNCLLLDA